MWTFSGFVWFVYQFHSTPHEFDVYELFEFVDFLKYNFVWYTVQYSTVVIKDTFHKNQYRFEQIGWASLKTILAFATNRRTDSIIGHKKYRTKWKHLENEHTHTHTRTRERAEYSFSIRVWIAAKKVKRKRTHKSWKQFRYIINNFNRFILSDE